MRITMTFNLRKSEDEKQAELFTRDYVDKLVSALEELKHNVTPLEVSGEPGEVVDKLLESNADLIFNMAEGVGGKRRESYYPAIYQLLGIPYTGGKPGLLHVGLDKRLAGKLLAIRGIRVPQAALLTPDEPDIPDDLDFPLFAKPNYEGSSMGITQESVIESKEEADDRLPGMLEKFKEGIIVEQFIRGREMTIPMLEAFPGKLLEIVEYEFDGEEHNIFDYETKSSTEIEELIEINCPPELSKQERHEMMTLAERSFNVMDIPDFGRADIRLTDDGVPYLIEVNPLPGLRPISPMITAAEARGLSYTEVIKYIILSARRRYGIEKE